MFRFRVLNNKYRKELEVELGQRIKLANLSPNSVANWAIIFYLDIHHYFRNIFIIIFNIIADKKQHHTLH